MTEALVAYAHFVAIIATGAALFAEITRCHHEMQPADINKLVQIDKMYFGCALLALFTGLARVFLVGKGVGFYSHNPVFYIKLALFIAVGLLSIPPTLQFARWKRALLAGEGRVLSGEQITVTRNFLFAQLALLLLIPLMAVLMSRGFGIQPAHP